MPFGLRSGSRRVERKEPIMKRRRRAIVCRNERVLRKRKRGERKRAIRAYLNLKSGLFVKYPRFLEREGIFTSTSGIFDCVPSAVRDQLVTTHSPSTDTSEMQLKREEQNRPLICITKGACSQATTRVLSSLSMCQCGNGCTERVGKNRRFPRKCPMSTCSS